MPETPMFRLLRKDLRVGTVKLEIYEERVPPTQVRVCHMYVMRSSYVREKQNPERREASGMTKARREVRGAIDPRSFHVQKLKWQITEVATHR